VASGAASPIAVSGLTNGIAYTFTVQATNSIGSTVSAPSSPPVTPVGPPGAPTIGTATVGALAGTAVVSFSAPVGTGGSPISTATAYVVTSTPDGKTNSGSGSPVTVSGLTSGVAYRFSVTVTNDAGFTSVPSALSNTVTASAGAPPGAPTSVVAARTGNPDGLPAGQVTVGFGAPVSGGGSAISGYTVTSNPPGGVDLNAGDPNPATVHKINNLVNGTAYTFSVTATNLAGAGTAGVSNGVIPATKPAAPTINGATGGVHDAGEQWFGDQRLHGDCLPCPGAGHLSLRRWHHHERSCLADHGAWIEQ
jgi:hypothetical protein